MAYSFQPVWKKVNEELCREIIAFWAKENALLNDVLPEKRARQVAVVMRDDQGCIGAVCTVSIELNAQLRQPMYFYRTFCAEQHRRHNTAVPMMRTAQNCLREYNLGLDRPEAIGILLEVESPYVNKRYPTAFWPQTQFGFIGYSVRGLPERVHYFEGFDLLPKASSSTVI